MRSSLFVRPNLKLFFLGALLIALAHNFITDARSQGSMVLTAYSYRTAPSSEAEVEKLLAETLERPSSQAYLQLSDYYRKRGDSKKAMTYLRRAAMVVELEHVEE